MNAKENERLKNRFQHFMLFLLLLFCFYIIKVGVIETYGVYVIGEFTHVSDNGKNGNIWNYRYHYKSTEYNWGSEGRIFENKLIFLKILPDKPSYAIPVHHLVPSCLGIKDVPTDGWKSLPPDTCK